MLYKFKTTPFAHQKEALTRSVSAQSYAFFMEMGTGKSKVAIDTAGILYQQGHIDAVLIFGNKGSYRNWVDTQVPTHLPDDIPRFSTHWDSAASKELVKTYDKLFDQDVSLKIFVMNIEALPFKRSHDLAMKFAKAHKTLLIVDESTTVKNPTANRTKAAIRIANVCKYKRIMTGEPITNSPLDLYSQCLILGPNMLGFTSYYAFRNTYANMVQLGSGQRSFKKIISYRNLDQLTNSLAKFSYRVKKEECLDLPPKVYQTHDVELTEEQQRLYTQLREEAITELQGQLITAPLVITRLLRMHQVICGHLKDDEGIIHEVPSKRLDALMEVIEETSGKVIIWANYRADIVAIKEALGREYGHDTAAAYYGDTDVNQRAEVSQSFQDPQSPLRFIVANQKTGGFGNTWTAATTVVYYSNNYDLELRLQSEDRAHRIGQTKSVNYVDLVARNTVDEKIIKALRGKRKIATEVLGDTWRDWI